MNTTHHVLYLNDWICAVTVVLLVLIMWAIAINVDFQAYSKWNRGDYKTDSEEGVPSNAGDKEQDGNDPSAFGVRNFCRDRLRTCDCEVPSISTIERCCPQAKAVHQAIKQCHERCGEKPTLERRR